MQQEREGRLCVFVLQHAGNVVIRIAGMDGQRQAGHLRRADMDTEILRLNIARCLVIEIVEPGFADADHARMQRHLGDRLRAGHARLATGIVRMHADAGEHAGIALGDGDRGFRLVHRGADGHHALNPGRVGAGDDGLAFGLGEVVEMAMRIDQHTAYIEVPAPDRNRA